ncbi:MAG: hypothetical protein U0U46_07055 [Saprospiraceae bacterium]|nr:hypothetical protein [Saprospiraceae bacterium]HNL37852.1 hypothetical protein [Saprospiraceae bacterium]
MLRNLFCIVLAMLATDALAQGFKPPVSGKGIIYNRETAFNFRLTTNKGFATGLEFGRLRTYYRTTYFQLNFGEVKHPKEQRQSPPPNVRSFRPFVFGKQNNFFIVRSGWGIKRYYSEKASHKGVAVGVSYSIGPSLGLLKPYYLALAYTSPDNPRDQRVLHQKYSDENADVFLDPTRILGASPFTKGIGELSLVPGGNASVAFHMDWGAFDEVVKALEIGLQVDVFPRKVPILVSEENSPVFFNFFVNLQLGKRQ